MEPFAYSLPSLGEANETSQGIYVWITLISIREFENEFAPTQNLGKNFRTAGKPPGPMGSQCSVSAPGCRGRMFPRDHHLEYKTMERQF